MAAETLTTPEVVTIETVTICANCGFSQEKHWHVTGKSPKGIRDTCVSGKGMWTPVTSTTITIDEVDPLNGARFHGTLTLEAGFAGMTAEEARATLAYLAEGFRSLAIDRAIPPYQGEKPTWTNEIFTIYPDKRGAVLAFDDEERGLKREALISGADTILLGAAQGSGWDPVEGFPVNFSSKAFPGAVEAVGQEDERGGRWYEVAGVRGWLCPALLRYFPDAPESIWFNVPKKS